MRVGNCFVTEVRDPVDKKGNMATWPNIHIVMVTHFQGRSGYCAFLKIC